jgi:hypothetical protein
MMPSSMSEEWAQPRRRPGKDAFGRMTLYPIVVYVQDITNGALLGDYGAACWRRSLDLVGVFADLARNQSVVPEATKKDHPLRRSQERATGLEPANVSLEG